MKGVEWRRRSVEGKEEWWRVEDAGAEEEGGGRPV